MYIHTAHNKKRLVPQPAETAVLHIKGMSICANDTAQLRSRYPFDSSDKSG